MSMSRILPIFRKDARHLWPNIAVFLFVLALSVWCDPTYSSGRDTTFYDLVSGLLMVACWNLVIAMIHEDRVPGDRQYWLTRPISWKDLLGAKALFVAAFINLPILLCHTTALAAVGISPFEWLPAIFWRQVFFTAFYVLPVAALAAVTRNLGQAVMGAILILLPMFVLQQFAYSRGAWMRANWETMGAVALVLICGAGAILAMQYARRSTGLSRWIGLAAGLAAAGVTLVPVDQAFARRDRDAVRITFEPRGGRPVRWEANGRGTVALEIPVRVDGVSADQDFLKRGMTLRLVGGGREWQPDRPEGSLHEVAAGRGWVSILVDRDWLQSTRGVPVDVYGTFDLTVFGEGQAFPAPSGGTVKVPGLGVCGPSSDDLGAPTVRCFSPAPRCSLYLGTLHGAVNWIVPRGLVEEGVPTDAGFQFLKRFSTQLPLAASAKDAQLIAARPVARVQAEFQFRELNLINFRKSD
jgi:hypothetical protein